MKDFQTGQSKGDAAVGSETQLQASSSFDRNLRTPELHVIRFLPALLARNADDKADVGLFMRQLHVLVSCGTPLVQALAALERQTRDVAWRQVFADVRSRVEQGASLSDAMASRGEHFNSVCCSLVAAGESSGNLAAMLDRLAVMTRRHLKVRTAVIGAIVYPCLLLTVAVGVLVERLVLELGLQNILVAMVETPILLEGGAGLVLG